MNYTVPYMRDPRFVLIKLEIIYGKDRGITGKRVYSLSYAYNHIVDIYWNTSYINSVNNNWVYGQCDASKKTLQLMLSIKFFSISHWKSACGTKELRFRQKPLNEVQLKAHFINHNEK